MSGERAWRRVLVLGHTGFIGANAAELEAAVKGLTNGKGFDATVDTTGSTAVRELCYRLTSHTGKPSSPACRITGSA